MQKRNDAGCTEELNTFINMRPTNDWAQFFPENACAFLQLEVQVGSLRFLDEYAGSEHFKLEGHAGRRKNLHFWFHIYV
jgi:hypothetical protein